MSNGSPSIAAAETSPQSRFQTFRALSNPTFRRLWFAGWVWYVNRMMGDGRPVMAGSPADRFTIAGCPRRRVPHGPDVPVGAHRRQRLRPLPAQVRDDLHSIRESRRHCGNACRPCIWTNRAVARIPGDISHRLRVGRRLLSPPRLLRRDFQWRRPHERHLARCGRAHRQQHHRPPVRGNDHRTDRLLGLLRPDALPFHCGGRSPVHNPQDPIPWPQPDLRATAHG